jgi:RNA ligase (TIGR02306 family)
MGVDTHKAEVVPVVLEKHPDADSLSIVRVYNFTVVARTADWQGVDKAVYIQPDSVMPDRPEYRFLKDSPACRKDRELINTRFAEGKITEEERDRQLAAVEAHVDANTKYLRIGVKKLRGVISMGMLLPAPEGAQIGDDVAEQLGITHYEPPIDDYVPQGSGRRHTGADVGPPPPGIFAPKYDMESIYKYALCFEPGELVYVTEKVDGQNARFVMARGEGEWAIGARVGDEENPVPYKHYKLYAGSRTEWKLQEGGSNWWRVQEQNPWIPQWCADNPDKVMYGESFGWVAPLRYGAAQGQLFFRAFDVIENGNWVDAEPFMQMFPEDRRVPCLGIMPFDFEKLQKLADGPSLVPGANNIREGIVIRPVKERVHYRLGRVLLKMVSLSYLEKSTR